MQSTALLALGALCALTPSTLAQDLLVEAESFADHGGWKLDTQFVESMGSPYLLAHGLGRPVADARHRVTLPAAGRWRVWVRTLDWVARWEAEGAPGRFELHIDGEALEADFGTQLADWGWHDGGVIERGADALELELALHDLTGFDGRCDAILFTQELEAVPPAGAEVLGPWRRERLGLPEFPIEEGPYDLVVVGGGYAGMAASIAGARAGLRVALIQNRPVLGGNGSSEVRVWAMGEIRRGRFPRIGEIVEEFADAATKSPGTYAEFGDAHKEALVRAEPNIDLFLEHHFYAVEMDGERIRAVTAFSTRTAERRRFEAPLFADCTGHGFLGAQAGADWDMTPAGRMGMSNMWRWERAAEPSPFWAEPWALDLDMDDFPYPRDYHAQWFWESGYDKHPIEEAEAIRDHNLRAAYGAFHAMKNRAGAPDHANARMTWLAYIGGPRESRRLLGDVLLTQEDIVEKRDFVDGCVPSTWSIDLHYPKEQYADEFPDNPFISIAVHDRNVDRSYGYPVPYRCFYSRNIANLFMAGRDISVTHEALGTVRVMKTCGMMGEVVGKAAAVCRANDCDPRGVYQDHLDELFTLLELPGAARRADLEAPFVVPEDALPRAGSFGPLTGIDPAELPGLVLDDRLAQREGSWTEGQGLEGYIGWGYVYAPGNSGARLVFEVEAPADGEHELRLAWRAHDNRSAAVPVDVHTVERTNSLELDMRTAPEGEHGFHALGRYQLHAGESVRVVVHASSDGGFATADALQILASE